MKMTFDLSHQINSARARAEGTSYGQAHRKGKWSRLTDKERAQRTAHTARVAINSCRKSK